MPIKSFRGMMASETQDKIHLSTKDGSTGYKITKFEIMPEKSMLDYEITAKIYKIEQSVPLVAANEVDMSDQTLLAAAFTGLAAGEYAGAKTVIFDNDVFNQDIYIQCQDNGGSNQNVNYYIELEQIKLDLNENTVATLKDIRNIKSD
tara:strand:+ start:428 stop:871 length:444 start_codon:yes stop_codon:yes gene_type:complete